VAVEVINQKTAKYFDEWGDDYSHAWKSVARRRLSEFETGLVRRAIELAFKNFGGGCLKTLDIGVGTGRITEVFLDYPVEHYGIDVSAVMVNHCQEKFKSVEKIKHLVVCDIVNPLPGDWGKFDVVSAIRVLPYTPQWREALQNIYQTLKPGGIFVFNFPNKYSSAIIPKVVRGGKDQSCASSYGELRRVLAEIGFAEVKITGFARLLDVFYARCDSEFSANILLTVEKFLRAVFGPTLFARLLYCTCQK